MLISNIIYVCPDSIRDNQSIYEWGEDIDEN